MSLFSYDDSKEAEELQDTTMDEEMGNTTDEKTQELAQEVERLVTSRQIILQHDLRITDIALMLNTNERYVSAAINQVIGCSFSDYINRYRIDYARKLQKEKPDMPASEIAFKAGFKSMSSFYRNMRKAGRE
jgi:YesN/AraC family two-component response regulator